MAFAIEPWKKVLISNHDTSIAGYGYIQFVLFHFHGLHAAVELCVVAIQLHGGACRGQADGGFQRLCIGVDACHIPLRTAAAGNDDVAAWITIDESHLIPGGGHLLHEVDGPCRSIIDVVGSQCEVLHAALEQDGSSQCIDIARHAVSASLVVGVVELVECRTSEVHRTYRVANEGVSAAIARFGIAGPLSEVQVL